MSSDAATDNLVANDGFEDGFKGWSRWGDNADRITLDETVAKSGKRSAKIQHGKDALFFSAALIPGKAYELGFAYRLEGENPLGNIALGGIKKGGALNSAGSEKLELAGKPGEWISFRKIFLPWPSTATCQFTFSADEGSTLWLDDVSLREVPRPADLVQPPDPWEGLKHRTSEPLFKELLTSEPGHYTVTSWAHDLQRKSKKGFKSEDAKDDDKWPETVRSIYKEAAAAGMGFMDLPGGRLEDKDPKAIASFHRQLHEQFGVRFDVWTEGSVSTAAALKNGAELLNPSAAASGRKPVVSIVDPKYIEAQEKILRHLGEQFHGDPSVGVFYGKDEPMVHLPEGPVERWGAYGQAMAKAVREQYGFGRFAPPVPKDKAFETDREKPLRWIAYNRWMNDRLIETRCQLSKALHQANPEARYTAVNSWFMSGFVPYDYSRFAACADLMDLDPYASSAERTRGRGVYNHGFGAKFMRDLTGEPVRIIAQAFDYAGYDMTPDDLREWVSQSLRCGASAIEYYEMDSPRWTHPDRWKMMLHIASVVTKMNRIDLPRKADTAILYTLYTHMSQGHSTSGDQLYAAHVLVGELAGSWHEFVSDVQLERGEKSLEGYKVVYLPLAKYMTAEATAVIEKFVENGGTLVCGDAEAFSFDLAGEKIRSRERLLGIRTVGPRKAAELQLKHEAWGMASGSKLKLFELRLGGETSAGQAFEIELADEHAKTVGVYPGGAPAIVVHKLGKGKVITFAANPFAPQVAVDQTLWPALFKGIQKKAGCKVDLPIWRFALPGQ